MNVMRLMMIALLAGGVLWAAAPAYADPPTCTSPDGTPCVVADPDGVTVSTPDGASGEVTPNVIEGSIPGGPSGEVTPTEVSGCVPGIGCLNIPR